MNKIIAFVKQQQFAPGPIGIFVNPFFLARHALYKHVASLAPMCTGKLLDVGCGTMPYRALFNTSSYTGLEIDSERARAAGIADHYYDGVSMPFDSKFFDSVICNQVLEHVFNPEAFLNEIARLIRPGGKLLLTVPFVWDEHEQPYDYARYSSFGLKHLISSAGFKIIDHRKTLDDFSVIGQIIAGYTFKKFWSRVSALNLILLIFVIFPTSLIFLLLGKILPKNEDLYLDNIVLAERL